MAKWSPALYQDTYDGGEESLNSTVSKMHSN